MTLLPCTLFTLIFYDILRLNPAASHSVRSVAFQYVTIKLSTILGGYLWNRLRKEAGNVCKIQNPLLMTIVKTNRTSEIGKRYKFSEIESREDFVKHVPVMTYRDIESYIDSMCEGESNVLTSEKVLFFAMTSGTTGKNKRFPVTQSYKMHFIKYCSLTLCGLMQNTTYPSDLQRCAVIRIKPTHYKTSSGNPLFICFLFMLNFYDDIKILKWLNFSLQVYQWVP